MREQSTVLKSAMTSGGIKLYYTGNFSTVTIAFSMIRKDL